MGYDAVVVGAGPNGLAAAITLAEAGRRVLLVEAGETVGGGARSLELTLPGFSHDVCSAVYPMAARSPFFRAQAEALAGHGLRWLQPPLPLAHPFDDRPAAVLERSLRSTSRKLGGDGLAWRRTMAPLVRSWDALGEALLAPPPPPLGLPLTLARFGYGALQPASWLARGRFDGVAARALFAGIAAHCAVPLHYPATAAFGLMLGAAGHAAGWPYVEGGAQRLADAMAARLRALGGELRCGQRVGSLAELPPARAVLLDLAPRQVVELAGSRLSARYAKALLAYRHGPGACKVDFALGGPIPWRDPACALAGTLHLGGTLEEVEAAEREAWRGRTAAAPFVLVAQHSRFDSSRAPAGQHTAWAYCHVPNGSSEDVSEPIIAQIERFAPGFRDLILARSVRSAAALERYNASCVGGDFNGGALDARQLFARPLPARVPYQTSDPGLLICSSATPPGGGVHGMCGVHAARVALRGVLARASS